MTGDENSRKNAMFHRDMDDALSTAAFAGHLEAVKTLLEQGADPFGRNGAALNLALFDGHHEVAALLQEAIGAEKAAFFADMAAQADIKNWLRQEYGDTDEVALVRACKMGCLGKVTEKMIAAGDRLTLRDLSQFREHEGRRDLLDLAVGSLQLQHILKPALWRGRLEEMQAVWQKVPEDGKEFLGVDFAVVQAAYHQMTLKEKHKGTGFKGFKP
ncbi:MAG: ankyrin repeat domain-containing protein [Alphaproteobacteria bacterium]|nr:ankyrin repeat domain-containing protein [Alphaproteobacteria bacterium]